ncbi:MAG: Hsp20/alpha crystallin family protein, partial [Candidatus Obscuribacterales bacterium]|nr:Hsp20/alpha crystallin family protein [Candidatus Obscuribacterales bacterium]
MFNTRYTRPLAVETRKTIVRPSLSHQPMSYGQMNWGMVENRDSRLWNRELRHDQHLNHDVRDLSREHLIGNGVSTYTTAADVLELDEQFIIEVALPGVVLDDVHLKIEDNVLSISAKRTPTLFEERAIVLQKELPSHYILRQFEFDTEIIAEQIE